MNRSLLLAAATASSVLFSQLAAAQTTVATDPVGFTTLQVAGSPTTGTPALSFLGLSMTQTVEFQGVASSSGAANAIKGTNSNWIEDQFNAPAGDARNAADKAYFVEVTSGPQAGRISDIVDTVASTQTIQIADNLGLSGGESFKIRRHWTLARVFGPNAGTNNQVLLGQGGASDADQVLIYDPAAAAYVTYYYKSSTRADSSVGWRRTTGTLTDDYSNQKLPITDGLIVRRQRAGDVAVTLPGAVKLGPSKRVILTDLNFAANVFPVPFTLGSSGLYNAADPTNSIAAGSASDADHVLVYDGTSYITYYYKASTRLNQSTGWRSTSGADALNTDVSGTPIADGKSVIIKRNGGRGAFTWTAPQPFPNP